MPSYPFNQNDKIINTKNMIEQAEKTMNNANIPTYAQQLQLNSFNKMMKQLNTENEQVTGTEELVLTMHPKKLAPGEISVRALTSIMGGLQSLTDSIANTLYNQPSEKGKIPQEILEQNELIFKGAKAGSFKAVIEMKHNDQLAIDDPEQQQVLDETFKLLYASRDEDMLSEVISFLGPRTLRTFQEWSKSVDDLDMDIDLDWQSSARGKQSFSINPINARKINNFLSDFSNISEDEMTITGHLVGANTRTKTFEIITLDKEKINGRIAVDALKNVASYTLGNACTVHLLKVTTKSSSVARKKISWTLQSIELTE